MNIQDYIIGDRSGKEAHQLEQEAMYDPFLQDALDGYDQINDKPFDYLDGLEKQIKKRTKSKSNYLSRLGIWACILIIAGLSVFYFLTDGNNPDSVFPVKRTYVENDMIPFPDSLMIIRKYSKGMNRKTISGTDNIAGIENTAENQSGDSSDEAESSIYQLLRGMNYEGDRSSQVSGDTEESNEATLSNNEIQSILNREYNPDELAETKKPADSPAPVEPAKAPNTPVPTETVKAPPAPALKPGPTVGEKAYNDYIEKNRKRLSDTAGEKPHGKVILIFNVNEKGRPVDIRVLRSLSQAADREAVRLLQSGPDWTVNSSNTRLEIAF